MRGTVVPVVDGATVAALRHFPICGSLSAAIKYICRGVGANDGGGLDKAELMLLESPPCSKKSRFWNPFGDSAPFWEILTTISTHCPLTINQAICQPYCNGGVV